MENSIITSKYLHKKFKKLAPTIITISTETPTTTTYNQQNDETTEQQPHETARTTTNNTPVNSAICSDVQNYSRTNSVFDPSTKNSYSDYDQVASISIPPTIPPVPTVPQQSSLNSDIYLDNSVDSTNQSQDISDNNGFILKWELSSSTTTPTTTDSNTVTIRINDDAVAQQQPTGGKYVCSYCNLACAKPSVLQKHIRAHTNERPYPCVSCGFSFKTRSNLYKHCRSRSHANRAKDSPEQSPPVEVKETEVPKSKPYKPKFRHNSYENENEEKKEIKPNTDLLKHINNIIHKNQTILENKIHSKFEHDEPLNLTARNRKRCMSETEHSQKSLIKELLLKNLTQEQSYVCQFCKISFKNIENFEIHRKKYCKVGENPTSKDIALVRSHSVNVASVLTQKYSRNNESPSKFVRTTLPLKSPGPYLGKTSLINDKPNQVFYENRNPTKIHHAAIEPRKFDFQIKSPKDDYLTSPGPFLQSPKKHTPIKLFGGEVKITETSGETRSFKIDSKNNQEYTPTSQPFTPSKINENMVVKSSLQSGGTMLTNNDESARSHTNLDTMQYQSPIKKERFNFEEIRNENYDRSLLEFNHKAAKMFAPNIKQPNLAIPGIPVPNKVFSSPKRSFTDTYEGPTNWSKFRTDHSPKLNSFINTTVDKPDIRLYDPLSIVVNGKLTRYVPGIPGPETGSPIHVTIDTPPIIGITHSPKIVKPKPYFTPRSSIPSPNVIQHTNDSQITSKAPPPKPEIPIIQEPEKTPEIPPKPNNKFLRPNSLSLKPHGFKTHHGLTPTIFNQALISPDTPRVAKKYCQLYLNGNCFTYLGLKSSTKSTYCTLNKTQPFYVQSFGTLSMYSQWRHLECKLEFVRLDTYDSRQRRNVYTMAQSKTGSLIVDSSYKPLMIESSQKKEENSNRGNTLPGGYESNEDYTYIRGRGRGKYVCDQCGIRCKKPSMLKKHIRTHSDVRPYTCQHCNFSFKTKGNLTKHMKSKAHYKRTSNSISTSDSNGETQTSQCSGTPSDEDSESDGENENDSDDSTRLQDHEAARCLLSLSQNRSPARNDSEMDTLIIPSYYTTTTTTVTSVSRDTSVIVSSSPSVLQDMSSRKPLTYPYVKIQTKTVTHIDPNLLKTDLGTNFNNVILGAKHIELFSQDKRSSDEIFSPVKVATPTKIQYIADKLPNADVTIANYQQKFVKYEQERAAALMMVNNKQEDFMVKRKSPQEMDGVQSSAKKRLMLSSPSIDLTGKQKLSPPKIIDTPPAPPRPISLETPPTRPLNFQTYEYQFSNPPRISIPQSTPPQIIINKPPYSNRNTNLLTVSREYVENRNASARVDSPTALDLTKIPVKPNELSYFRLTENNEDAKLKRKVLPEKEEEQPSEKTAKLQSSDDSNDVDLNQHNNNNIDKLDNSSNEAQSAMQTLAEIATKRVSSTEENTKRAQSLATEYLKLAKNETAGGGKSGSSSVIIDPVPGCNGNSSENSISDLIVKSEENKSCTICSKNFSKPSQLRLHMNIHYIERPFRCESCSVSFRSKGHLQKHERSASHHNKLSSSPTTSSSEPRPFKCSDCSIAFRIHGHLAKHLRSKMHIMRLECLARVPFGLYAELERANSLLTEINTTDCDMCLQSLKILARKLFNNDPSKLVQIDSSGNSLHNIPPPQGNKDQQICVGSP